MATQPELASPSARSAWSPIQTGDSDKTPGLPGTAATERQSGSKHKGARNEQEFRTTFIYNRELTEKDFLCSTNNELYHKKNSAAGWRPDKI